MQEILEIKEVKRPKLIINNDIDDSKIMFPEKLKRANAMLDKYPLPPSYSPAEQESGIEVKGILRRADSDTNTFFVVKMEGFYEIYFNIFTEPQTLNTIVKNYWGETINVQIRPQINKDNQFEYELIAVK